MMKSIVIAAVLVSLAACSPKREFEVKLDDGERAKVEIDSDNESGVFKTDDATVQFGENITNAVYPKGSSQYPGSKVIGFTRMQGGAENNQDLVMVNLETTASGSEIIDYYKKTAKDAGLITRNESVTAEGGMVSASSEDNKDQLNVIIMRDSGKTVIMVTGGVPPE